MALPPNIPGTIPRALTPSGLVKPAPITIVPVPPTSSSAVPVPPVSSKLRRLTTGALPTVAPKNYPVVPLAGWGNHPLGRGAEIANEDLERASLDATLARGLGRSYGDASLPLPGKTVVATPPANRFLAFDKETGVMRAEAGVTVEEIFRLLLPRGWFVPVTPGTKYVTLGGMVAADVHGKNHHRDGTFGNHVRELKLRVADGRIVDCSPTVEPELFAATIGGMGLTGHILEVTFTMAKVASPWIWCESEGVPDIETFIDRLAEAAAGWPMTMGWIDCLSTGKNLGRGVIYRGRWATPDEAPKRAWKPKPTITMPVMLPSFSINKLTTSAFNALYYAWNGRVRKGVIHPEAFFYPLDAILHWNRFYGRAGFTQYQCVIPHAAGKKAARRFMEVVAEKGGASPLCVIKDCGAEGLGTLSFPKPGISIAIDFPVRPWTQGVIDALNEIVLGEGGRIYLAKDAFTRKDHFERMEPRLAAFQAVRRRWDPEGRLGSQLGARLLDGAQ